VTLLAVSESRAGEWFMKVAGVPGQITEGPRAGWTPVKMVTAIVTRPTTTNGLTEPATFSCKVTKSIDCLSPLLAQSCATGQIHQPVTFTYVVTNPGSVPFRLTLNAALVASMRQTSPAAPEEDPQEEVEFRFNKVEWAALDFDSSGGLTGGLTALFDQSTGEGALKTRLPLRATIARQAGRPGLLVTWPVEGGHRYRILSCETGGGVWKTLLEKTASEDGNTSEFIPVNAPILLMRVEEVE
jgi:type VI protein secretion system component Hcp